MIKIGNKEYSVKEARTEEQKKKGLQNVESLPSNEGMLFYYDPPQEVSMWMKDTKIPLDIIFINEDQEVISVKKGTPNNEKLITEQDVAFVLEVNQDSGIKKGDELELETKDPVMKVLNQDGTDQFLLWGGERIFSRKNTQVLIKQAKKADLTKSDSDYKALGNYMFKCIKQQDTRQPEYVNVPNDQK